MRRHLRSRRGGPVATLAICGALLAGCAQPHQVAAEPSATPVPAAVLSIPGQVSGLVFDPGRNGLWYLVASGAVTDLMLFHIADATTSTIRLPALPNDGSDWRKVAVAPDGSVWVASGYVLVRIGADGQAIQRLNLPLRVNGMLPNALDPGIPLPGTWIAAMTFTADSRIVVARDNVPFLQVFTPSMAMSTTVMLPAGLDGLSDMALGPDGLRYRPSHAHGAAPAAAYQVLPMPSLQPPARPQLLLTDSAGSMAALTVVGPGGQFITFDARFGMLTWSAGGSTATRQIQVRSGSIEIAAPNGRIMTVTAYAQVGAATFDNAGGLWYLQTWDDSTQLMRA